MIVGLPAQDVVGGQSVGEARFLEWAKAALIPLSADGRLTSKQLTRIGQIVGSARIVALTEAVHGAEEPLLFRNQVFQYLAESKGFKGTAIESGIVESRE